jgi:hypothetical protein
MLSVGDSVAEPGRVTMPGAGDAIGPDIRGGKLSDNGPAVKSVARVDILVRLPFGSGAESQRDAVLDQVTAHA